MTRRLLICFCLAVSALRAADWSHVLPADLYKALDLNQRAQLDKALELYDKGRDGDNRDQQMFHKSAANEWERFRVQHGDALDPSVFAYSLFMQAMSQRRAADRHTAVKTFTEVLDFFPDEVWLAAPALYFRAMTHGDIGDRRKELADLQAMLEDPDYRRHPLAGYAYNRVADNHWENKRTREAEELWKHVDETFPASNRAAARHAGDRLRDWYIVQRNIDAALAMEMEGVRGKDDLDKQVNARKELFERARRGLDRDFKDWYYGTILGGKDKADQDRARTAAAFRDWFLEQAPLFDRAGRTWEFLMIRFDELARNDRKALETFIPEVSAFLRKGDAAAQRKRADDLLGRLLNLGEYGIATTLLEFYPDPAERLWVRYDIQQRQKNYGEADQVLGQLLEMEDPDQVSKARRTRANLYHHRMGKYEEAIKLYYEINDPPGTLWDIADCHRRNNAKQEAQNTLTEIASIFPDEAAKAIFAKAEYFRHDGEKQSAIGLYRNLLAHPEWRKSREASRAHDRLEDMGIATGGAVIHEVN